MNFKGQAGQDWYVWYTLVLSGKKRIGTFLDIGACEPVRISNTYLLEQAGWTGFLMDNDPGAIERLKEERKSVVIHDDATKFDYKSLPIHDFDYLSLDVDAASLDSLKKLLADGITFRMATVESDSYRFGNGPRDEMRALLLAAGYIIDRADVFHPGAPDCPYEDWWIDPKRV